MAEVEHDDVRGQFEDVECEPAEVMPRREVELDVPEASGAADPVPVPAARARV